MKFFTFVQKQLPLFLVAAMGLGLWKSSISPIAFSKLICFSALLVMIYPVMINLRIENGFKLSGIGKPLFYSLLINFIISPLFAIGLSSIFFANNPYIAIGLYMIGLIPTSGMTLNWIHNTKADMDTGIALITLNILFTVLIVPFILPVLIQQVLHINNVSVDPLIILEKLGFVIVMPMVLGWLTRVLFKTINKATVLTEAKPLLNGISNLGLLLVMFLIMSLESSKVLFDHVGDMLAVFIPMGIYYLGMFLIITSLIQKNFVKEQGLVILFTTFLRYHVISLGIALAAFGTDPNGTWVLLPIISALLIQPIATSFLVKGSISKLKFQKNK